MSTGVAKLAQAELPPPERIARALLEAAEENPLRAPVWGEGCCSNQLRRLTHREAELLRLEEDLKLRADELDRQQDALSTREV